MRDKVPPTTSPKSLTRTVLTVVAACMGLAAIYSCSLIVESRSQQCQADSDCSNAGFAGSKCDTMRGVCIAAAGSTGPGASGSGPSGSSSSSSTTSSSGTTGCDVDGGIDAGGCYNCPPTSDPEFLNACTDGCIAFDNNLRVTLLDGGVLPPLNDAGPNDAGM
jgi:hypothetical protein